MFQKLKKTVIQAWFLAVSCFVLVSIMSCAGADQPEDTLYQKLQQALDSARIANNGIGASAAVQFPGENLWHGVSGNSHGNTAITTSMLFQIGSVTKTITATLVLKLAEDGILRLEDTLSEWIPTFPNINPQITIRQLLNHTSGVFGFFNNGEIWDEMENDPSRLWTPQEVLAYVLEPYFTPGTGWHYANTNYILLGMIIRNATGVQVSTVMRNRLWNPLALNNSYLAIEETLPDNIAHTWSDWNGDGLVEDVSSLPRRAHDSIAWTAGAVFSTAGDLVKFFRALFGGEIVGQADLDQMLEFIPTPADFGALGYGLGITEFYPSFTGGLDSIGHTGAGYGGHITILAYLPDHDVSLCVMVNDDNGDSLYAIKDSLIQVVMNHL